MGNQRYKEIQFQSKSLDLIQRVNGIITQYNEQGYELTLRQVYYQLVARGIIPNNERSYKNLGNLINDGRLAGMIDWKAIVDRTRNLCNNSHWSTPESVINSALYSYMLDRWANQPNYVEVWVEKDALIGIVGQICRELDVPHFSCRGYTSQSEMWVAAQRFIRQNHRESRTIIHLGDHDPSGIDMSRDIQDRLTMFGADVYIKRVALTMTQIETYSPPPNPTKLTDARANSYISCYGYECWELDALEPSLIANLIRDEVSALSDHALFETVEKKEREDKSNIQLISDRYDEVVEYLQGYEGGE